MSLKDLTKINPSLVPPRLAYDLSSPEAIQDSVALVRQKWSEVMDWDNYDFYRRSGGYGITLADMKVCQLYDKDLFQLICENRSLPETVPTNDGEVPWMERIQTMSTQTLCMLPIDLLKNDDVGFQSWSSGPDKRTLHEWKAWPALATDDEFLNENINQFYTFPLSSHKIVHVRLEEFKATCPEKIQAACAKIPKVPSWFASDLPEVTLAQLASLQSKDIHKLLPYLLGSTQALLSNEQIQDMKPKDYYKHYKLLDRIARKHRGPKKELRYELIFGVGDVTERRQRLDQLPPSVYQDLFDCIESLPGHHLVAWVETLTADEFESLWPRLKKLKGEKKRSLLPSLNDAQRDRLHIESLNSKELQHLFFGHDVLLAESQRRFQKLSLSDQKSVLRQAEFIGVLSLIPRELRTQVNTELLCQKLIDRLFPTLPDPRNDSVRKDDREVVEAIIADRIADFSHEQLESLLPRLDPSTQEFILEMDYSKYWRLDKRINPFWK